MLPSEEILEQEIQAKNLNAPRLSPTYINARMEKVTYHTYHIPGTTSTVAVAFDENGFSLACHVGACASPENFDAEVGVKAAIRGCEILAREAMWKLEGYHLKRQLAG